jgi:hypothetical protein
MVELLDLLEEVRPVTPQELLIRRMVAARRFLAVKELAVYWRQCFSFKLCKFGSKNTTFYHASASARLHSNKIQVLHEDGVSAYTHAAKQHILHAFYANLLGTASPVVMSQQLLDLFPPSLGCPRLRPRSHHPKQKRPSGKCKHRVASTRTALGRPSTANFGRLWAKQ